MPNKDQTNVPKQVRADRPAFYRWEGVIKNSSGDVVKEIEEARKRRARV